MIAPGTKAPEFKLDSHANETVRSADLVGKKNQLLVFYPLDFTPT
jgi:peroxiredoxin